MPINLGSNAYSVVFGPQTIHLDAKQTPAVDEKKCTHSHLLRTLNLSLVDDTNNDMSQNLKSSHETFTPLLASNPVTLQSPAFYEEPSVVVIHYKDEASDVKCHDDEIKISTVAKNDLQMPTHPAAWFSAIRRDIVKQIAQEAAEQFYPLSPIMNPRVLLFSYQHANSQGWNLPIDSANSDVPDNLVIEATIQQELTAYLNKRFAEMHSPSCLIDTLADYLSDLYLNTYKLKKATDAQQNFVKQTYANFGIPFALAEQTIKSTLPGENPHGFIADKLTPYLLKFAIQQQIIDAPLCKRQLGNNNVLYSLGNRSDFSWVETAYGTFEPYDTYLLVTHHNIGKPAIQNKILINNLEKTAEYLTRLQGDYERRHLYLSRSTMKDEKELVLRAIRTSSNSVAQWTARKMTQWPKFQTFIVVVTAVVWLYRTVCRKLNQLHPSRILEVIREYQQLKLLNSTNRISDIKQTIERVKSLHTKLQNGSQDCRTEIEKFKSSFSSLKSTFHPELDRALHQADGVLKRDLAILEDTVLKPVESPIMTIAMDASSRSRKGVTPEVVLADQKEEQRKDESNEPISCSSLR